MLLSRPFYAPQPFLNNRHRTFLLFCSLFLGRNPCQLQCQCRLSSTSIKSSVSFHRRWYLHFIVVGRYQAIERLFSLKKIAFRHDWGAHNSHHNPAQKMDTQTTSCSHDTRHISHTTGTQMNTKSN